MIKLYNYGTWVCMFRTHSGDEPGSVFIAALRRR